MKKVKLSIAALTLVVAIAGTTTANATKKTVPVFPCSVVDPSGDMCPDLSDQECCERDGVPVYGRQPV